MEYSTRTEIQRYVRQQALLNLVVNFVLNGAIAWWLLHEQEQISAWGDHAYGSDLLITGFLLSSILAVIVLKIHHRKRDGGLLPTEPSDSPWLNRLPHNPWTAALVLGVLGTLIAAPMLIALLQLTGFETLAPLPYALIKGVWAGVWAAILVILCIRSALRPQPL
jgi:hypothetical protein